MEDKLLQLIKSASKILVTSHISPDPDAISSVILAGDTLKRNFSDKKIKVVVEEEPNRDLSFLKGYGSIEFMPILKALEEFKPNLIILLDGNNFDRASRSDGDKVREYVKNNGVRTIVIDHHEPAGKDEVDLFINNGLPATVQELYTLLFEKLKLAKPDGYAEATMLGILTDTYRHKYFNPAHRETFRIVSDLIDAGVSVEKLENRLERYSPDQMLIISELAKNFHSTKEGYNYSFISDEFTSNWTAGGKSTADLKSGGEAFTNEYVRNVGENEWGFILYPELAVGPNCYGLSLRAVSGGIDVSAIAQRLGGGGHKPAAGAKIKAGSVREALELAKQAITSR